MAAAAARLLLGLLLQAARVLDLLLLCLNGTQEQGVMGRPIKAILDNVILQASLFSRTQFDPSLGDVSRLAWSRRDGRKIVENRPSMPSKPENFSGLAGADGPHEKLPTHQENFRIRPSTD